MEMLFRFDKPRPFQDEMIKEIYENLNENRNIIVNAPTGIGKTDASICAALTYALENDLSVFFLTPKISQHKIAVECLAGLRKKYPEIADQLRFVDMVGKQNLCINEDINLIDSGAFYSACNTRVKNGKCSYYKNAHNIEDIEKQTDIVDGSLMGHNALFESSYNKGLCAYEISAMLSKKARIVIADYSHILNPYIRGSFLKKISHDMHNSIVIWDEAHNIINAANSYFSSKISMKSIERARKELESVGSNIDLGYLEFAISNIAEKRIKNKKEAFAEIGDFPKDMSNNIESIVSDLEKAGMKFSEEKKARNSAILHIARFLSLWFEEDESIARIITIENGIPKLMISSLYPQKSIHVFAEAKANIFMSATLVPLNMYEEIFGIDRAELKNYQSPFPKANRLAFVDESVTTKYNKRSNEMYKRIADNIARLKGTFAGNMAVFLPSFEMIKNIQRNMPVGTILYVQREGMKSAAIEGLLNDFKNSTNSIIFGVNGGSLGEGIDYANNLIKCIVIVGIPLGKPDLETNARIEYFNTKFEGKGIDYAYVIPALMRSIQAAGRAIRSEKDRAAIIFMDERYAWNSYYSIINSMVKISSAANYLHEVRKFFSGTTVLTPQTENSTKA